MTYDSPRDYVGNFVYAGQDGLELILAQEGVVDVKASQYQYYLKDHLGNTRVMFTKVGTKVETLQESHYYPFGMRFARGNFISNDNKYLYNGKELQDDKFEITGGEFRYLDWYDYGARFYDVQLERWHVQDPLTEKYFTLSQYNYVSNNPLRLVDPTGMEYSPYYDEETGDFLGVDEFGFYGQIKVTSREVYQDAQKNSDGSVNSADINANSQTRNIQDSYMTDESIANVYTDIVAKMEDSQVTSARLYNGSISLFNNTIINGSEAGGFNNPDFAPGASHYNSGLTGHKITMNRNSRTYLNTVENAQNTLGAHEILGHGVYDLGGTGSGEHYRVYEIQMSHSTWENTTNYHKQRTVNNYLEELHEENPSKYNSDPRVYQLYMKYVK